MEDLESYGINTLTMDVTDDESMRAGVAAVEEREGRIDILVNNAGYGFYGAIEDVPMSEARRQFEVNVFGAMRLAQLVLPGMSERSRGRIVNVSSIGGFFSMALGGWYHATKYAMEALSDALRQEASLCGVDVVLVEPGLTATSWEAIAAKNLRATSGLGKYSLIANNFATALEVFGQGFATQPSVIGELIARAALVPRPRTRYRKGMGALPLTTMARVVPDRLMDCAIMFFLTHADALIDAIHTSEAAHGAARYTRE